MVPHIRQPNPWDLQWKENTPKLLGVKSNGAYFQKNPRAIGNGKSTLKGLVHRLTQARTQCKSNSLKGTETFFKKVSHLLIPNYLLEEQGPVGTLSKDEGADSPHCCAPSLCPVGANTDRHRFGLRPASSNGSTLLLGTTALAILPQPTDLCNPHRGWPLDVCVWWPGEIAFLCLRSLKESEAFLGRLPAPGHCTNRRLKHDPDLHEKKAFLYGPGASV